MPAWGVMSGSTPRNPGVMVRVQPGHQVVSIVACDSNEPQSGKYSTRLKF